MSLVITDSQNYTNIASAIRSKAGTSDMYKPSEMASAIADISGGGGSDDNFLRAIGGSVGNIVDSECTSVGAYAFAYSPFSGSISMENVSRIGTSAFYSCSLTGASFSLCTVIDTYAFGSCSSLSVISFPEVSFIGPSAFYACNALTEANFPACTSIMGYAFTNCYSLASISFPVCTSTGNNAFMSCSVLTKADFPVCTFIGNATFSACSALISVSFPACTVIGPNAFYRCSVLKTASFPVCTSIGGQVFSSCIALTSIYFLGSVVPTLSHSNAFYGTTCAIYVRASLLTAFQSAANWSVYSSRIVGLTDEQIAQL